LLRTLFHISPCLILGTIATILPPDPNLRFGPSVVAIGAVVVFLFTLQLEKVEWGEIIGAQYTELHAVTKLALRMFAFATQCVLLAGSEMISIYFLFFQENAIKHVFPSSTLNRILFPLLISHVVFDFLIFRRKPA